MSVPLIALFCKFTVVALEKEARGYCEVLNGSVVLLCFNK